MHTTLPLNSDAIGDSFRRTLFCRAFCSLRIKVRKMYLFLITVVGKVPVSQFRKEGKRKNFQIYTHALEKGLLSSVASTAAAMVLVWM